MSDLTYTDPRTGEVINDPEVRPFREVLAELGEGATESELSEALWLVIQRVQETAKAGSLTLHLAVGFDGQGRLVVKDESQDTLAGVLPPRNPVLRRQARQRVPPRPEPTRPAVPRRTAPLQGRNHQLMTQPNDTTPVFITTDNIDNAAGTTALLLTSAAQQAVLPRRLEDAFGRVVEDVQGRVPVHVNLGRA